MSKKIKTLLVAAVAVMCVLFSSVTPAFAFVDPTWEESAEETPAEETVIEETPVEESPVEEAQPDTEQPFSTPGNGDLGDEITSGMKDFYTIHTKNNNTLHDTEIAYEIPDAEFMELDFETYRLEENEGDEE